MKPCCSPHRETCALPPDRPAQTDLASAERAANNAGMVMIPGGTFRMGTSGPETQVEDGEGPVREVTLDAFWIDTCAVSNADFAAFVAATGYVTEAEMFGWSYVFFAALHPLAQSHVIDTTIPEAPWWLAVKGATWAAPDGPGSDLSGKEDHPVVHVSWHDAAAYAAWTGKRLPTEAEWEKAARGGLDQVRYAWGDELHPDESHMCNIWQGYFPQNNTGDDGYLTTAPIRHYAPNGFGLYCVAGNVWEWCSDRWSPIWHHTASPETRTNPQGPTSGDARVIRGGSYLCHASYCNRYRVGARTFSTPDSATAHMGFRCAASL